MLKMDGERHMGNNFRLLLIEDNAIDAELTLRELRNHYKTLEARLVATETELRAALSEFEPHVVISDFSMPGFSGLRALDLVRAHDTYVPFVFLSGTIGEERAIEALKRGATDYVLKDNMRRLHTAVERALEEAHERRARKRAEAELRETRDRLESILKSLQEVVWSISLPDQRVTFMNEATRSVYGREPAEFLADHRLRLKVIHPDDREMVGGNWQRLLNGGKYFTEYRISRPDGAITWVHDRARAHFDARGQIIRIDGITSDITARKQQEARILRLSSIHRSISAINSAITHTQDQNALVAECCRILVTEAGFRLAYIADVTADGVVSPRASAGPSADYLALRFDGRSAPDPHRDEVLRLLELNGRFVCNDIASDTRMPRRKDALERGLHSFAVLKLPARTASIVIVAMYAPESGYFDQDELSLLADVASEIGNALDQVTQAAQLEYLATHDPLTGLFNKGGLSTRVAQTLGLLREKEQLLAWVVLNISRFSQINESLGRQLGDALLQQVARRLCSEHEGDMCCLARIDADHFVIVPPPFDHAEQAAHFIEDRLLRLFDEPFNAHDTLIHLPIKLGIALAPHDGEDVDTLLVSATTAVRRANNGPEPYVFYESAMNASIAERLSLENRLRRALDKNQFVLHYQPKIDLVSGQISGAEALIRWNDPESGLVPPIKFIPLLEETGLIVDVGAWVIRQALADLATLHRAGHRGLDVAVNVSRVQIGRTGFIQEIAALLDSNLPPEQSLSVEITESMIMGDLEETVARLSALRDMNIEIAIDDFGTGYSSLSVISKLPINILKIDRSFVVNMTKTPQDMAMVSTIVNLAHALNLRVVAEGVDSDEQLRLLKLLRCDEIQGYLFSPPVPIDKLASMLEQQRSGQSGRN
jgi:diguanylate cyclase (GGDEF)-like protein/PAS domain S-box-containing protein